MAKRIIDNFPTCQRQEVVRCLDLVVLGFWFSEGSFEPRHKLVSFVVVYMEYKCQVIHASSLR